MFKTLGTPWLQLMALGQEPNLGPLLTGHMLCPLHWALVHGGTCLKQEVDSHRLWEGVLESGGSCSWSTFSPSHGPFGPERK